MRGILVEIWRLTKKHNLEQLGQVTRIRNMTIGRKHTWPLWRKMSKAERETLKQSRGTGHSRKRRLDRQTVKQIFTATGTKNAIANRHGVGLPTVARITNRTIYVAYTDGLKPGIPTNRPSKATIRDVFNAEGPTELVAAQYGLYPDQVDNIRKFRTYRKVTGKLWLQLDPDQRSHRRKNKVVR